jgi:hypothetical protein
VKTTGRGRAVDEWKLRPSATEDHWLDCLVGCAVAASIQGVTLFGAEGGAMPARPRLNLSELQQQIRMRRGPQELTDSSGRLRLSELQYRKRHPVRVVIGH